MIITLKGANFASSNIGTLDSWLISKSLTGVTIDNAATSVKKGEAYKAVITLKENYTFPDTITVTMAGTDITSTYVTKTATTITINIPSVTGNIVIRVNATSNVVGVTYSITRTLTALTAGSNVNTITSGDTYEETFSIPKEMYDGNISGSGVEVDFTITMGGTELDGTGVTAEYVYTSPDGSKRTTGFKITVPNVNGNIVITAISYVPFDESVEVVKVHRYDEDDKSIDINNISIGSPIMYSAVDGAKIYGWRMPAGSRVTLTFNPTGQISNAEAMVLLHKTTYAVLDYASTYRASLGLGPDGKPLPRPNTHTFTNVYNDDVLLEANEGVIVSGRYTVVGGGITPDTPVDSNIAYYAVNKNLWSDGEIQEGTGRISITTYFPTGGKDFTVSSSITTSTIAKRYYDSNKVGGAAAAGSAYGRVVLVVNSGGTALIDNYAGETITVNGTIYTLQPDPAYGPKYVNYATNANIGADGVLIENYGEFRVAILDYFETNGKAATTACSIGSTAVRYYNANKVGGVTDPTKSTYARVVIHSVAAENQNDAAVEGTTLTVNNKIYILSNSQGG